MISHIDEGSIVLNIDDTWISETNYNNKFA